MKPDFFRYFRSGYSFSTKELISVTSFGSSSNVSSCIFDRSGRPWEKNELYISSNYIFGLFMEKKIWLNSRFSISILSLFHFTFTSRKRAKAFFSLCTSQKEWNPKLFTSRIKEKCSLFTSQTLQTYSRWGLLLGNTICQNRCGYLVFDWRRPWDTWLFNFVKIVLVVHQTILNHYIWYDWSKTIC